MHKKSAPIGENPQITVFFHTYERDQIFLDNKRKLVAIGLATLYRNSALLPLQVTIHIDPSQMKTPLLPAIRKPGLSFFAAASALTIAFSGTAGAATVLFGEA